MPPQWSASLFYDLQLEPGNVGGLVEGLEGWAPASSICLLPQRFVNGNRGVQSILQLVFLCAFGNKVTLTILILKARRNLEITMVGV